ncbi:MAG: hypothetical protein ACPGRZ_14755 [Alphaproteobacteria bacterium]
MTYGSLYAAKMAKIATKTSSWVWEGIDFRNLFWVFLALGVMIVAIVWGNNWFLRYVHVASGVLLTGADILFGFVVGPVLRSLPFEARKAFSLKMLPKTLFIMQTLGIMAPTSGWYLAVRMGYLDLGYPEFWWVIAALVIATILAVQGLGILLPTNLRAYLEMRKDNPDPAKIQRIMRTYFYTLASQGVFQVLIVVIMVKFATGV